MRDSKEIVDGWKTFCERLYQDRRASEINELIATVEVIVKDERSTLLDEVREMVNTMKKCKALSCDGIEAWQADNENGIKAVWYLCNVIWQKDK